MLVRGHRRTIRCSLELQAIEHLIECSGNPLLGGTLNNEGIPYCIGGSFYSFGLQGFIEQATSFAFPLFAYFFLKRAAIRIDGSTEVSDDPSAVSERTCPRCEGTGKCEALTCMLCGGDGYLKPRNYNLPAKVFDSIERDDF
jgi:hypothetical protein